MADDESSSVKDDRDKDDPLRALSGFLSETTRRVRRTLLALSVGAVVAKILDFKFGKLVVFGNTVEVQDERVALHLVGAVLLYFVVLFGVYVAGDTIRAQKAIKRAVYPDGRLNLNNLPVMVFRIVLDLGVPLVAGVWAMVVWK